MQLFGKKRGKSRGGRRLIGFVRSRRIRWRDPFGLYHGVGKKKKKTGECRPTNRCAVSLPPLREKKKEKTDPGRCWRWPRFVGEGKKKKKGGEKGGGGNFAPDLPRRRLQQVHAGKKKRGEGGRAEDPNGGEKKKRNQKSRWPPPLFQAPSTPHYNRKGKEKGKGDRDRNCGSSPLPPSFFA